MREDDLRLLVTSDVSSPANAASPSYVRVIFKGAQMCVGYGRHVCVKICQGLKGSNEGLVMSRHASHKWSHDIHLHVYLSENTCISKPHQSLRVVSHRHNLRICGVNASICSLSGSAAVTASQLEKPFLDAGSVNQK